MDFSERVCVVIPVHNGETTIERAIMSVLNQTYKNIRILVVDDCSTDKTSEILQSLARKHSLITILNNDINRGVSYSRNRGALVSQERWLAFLDADDFWEESKLECQMQVAQENKECSVFFTASSYVDVCGEKSNYIFQVPQKVTFKELLKQNVISCSSVLIDKKVILKYPMEEQPMIHEDYLLWLRWLKEGNYAIGINKPLLIYQISNGSKSGNKIRSAIMNLKTYRLLGLSSVKAMYYMACYTVRGLRKYKGINLK